jgi:hypothetical protein
MEPLLWNAKIAGGATKAIQCCSPFGHYQKYATLRCHNFLYRLRAASWREAPDDQRLAGYLAPYQSTASQFYPLFTNRTVPWPHLPISMSLVR